MRIRLAVPDELDDQDRKAALDAALESVTRSSMPLIRSGKIPPAAAAIRAKLVEWRPEPPGDEHFDLPHTMLQRGWGDCDDLAPWHAASLRASRTDPGARAVVRKSGPARWHAVVQRSDGSIDDPSKAAGMGRNGHGVNGLGGHHVVGAYAPIQAPMSEGRLCLAISPGRDPEHPAIWYARCDVPDRLEPWDWSSMAQSDHPARSLLHAVTGCRTVAGPDMDPRDQARLSAVHDLILGYSADQVADAVHTLMGDYVDADAVVGEAAQSVGFFGSLLRAVASPLTSAARFAEHPSLRNAAGMFTAPITAAAKVAQPFASAIRFIPGVGPVAATAAELLSHPPTNLREAAQFAAQQGAGFVPGIGPMLAHGIPGLPGMLHPLMAAMQAGAHRHPPAILSAPTMAYDPGKVARPWGARGPAVMRF